MALIHLPPVGSRRIVTMLSGPILSPRIPSQLLSVDIPLIRVVLFCDWLW
jgi:hypothetical protein